MRWMDCVKYDMKQTKIHPEWVSDGESWFDMIQHVNTTRKLREGDKGEKLYVCTGINSYAVRSVSVLDGNSGVQIR